MTHGLARDSVTASTTLAATLARLEQCELVDALARYGPRQHSATTERAADYDVLVLVTERPKSLMQVWTTIGGRSADVLFVDTRTYDDVLRGRRRLSASSIDAVFMVKLRAAEILVDRSGRMARGQAALRQRSDWLRSVSYSGRYLLWFSQNFGLAHLKRLATSNDPMYLMATDVLLASYLSATIHAYFEMRQLAWEGDKAALKHLQTRDPDYFDVLGQFLSAKERGEKVALYEALVTRTVQPFGDTWRPGGTAVNLETPVHDRAHVDAALDYWERMCAGGARISLTGVNP